MFLFRFIFSALLFVSFTAIVVLGQKESKNSVPKWERYVGSGGDISVLMPKMPVVIPGGSRCSKLKSVEYWAYTEEAAYQFKIVSRDNGAWVDGCRNVTAFGEPAYRARIDELKASKDKTSEAEVAQGGKKGWKISAGVRTTWVLEDLKKNRWIELVILHRPDIKVDEDRYVGSVDFLGKQNGIKIGDGSKWSVGDMLDFEPDTYKEDLDDQKKEKIDKLFIAAKPRANYTDSARQNNVAGDVKLKVTFLANGSVGEISVVSGLPYGLTEQAIAAAKKVVFLPVRKNGKVVTVTKTIQYSFTIY